MSEPSTEIEPADKPPEATITVIVNEISMQPVAEQYAVTADLQDMADYYGVDPTREAVRRAIAAESNRTFRPVRSGTLMMADVAPEGWNGDFDSLPTPAWADAENELERGPEQPLRKAVTDGKDGELPTATAETLFG